MLNEAMKPQRAGGRPKDVIRQRMAMQVVDEPAYRRGCFHPGDETSERVVAQMMREVRADDDVNGGGRLEIEHVCRNEADRAP